MNGRRSSRRIDQAARSRRAHLGVQPFEAAAFVVALRKISDTYLDLGV